MVLEETCSEVEGSNMMILPFVLPENVSNWVTRFALGTHTEGNIAVFHPCCDSQMFVRGKSSDFIARH
jgi:hypothetical protein